MMKLYICLKHLQRDGECVMIHSRSESMVATAVHNKFQMIFMRQSGRPMMIQKCPIRLHTGHNVSRQRSLGAPLSFLAGEKYIPFSIIYLAKKKKNICDTVTVCLAVHLRGVYLYIAHFATV